MGVCCLMVGRVEEREEVIVTERWGSDSDGRRGRREMKSVDEDSCVEWTEVGKWFLGWRKSLMSEWHRSRRKWGLTAESVWLTMLSNGWDELVEMASSGSQASVMYTNEPMNKVGFFLTSGLFVWKSAWQLLPIHKLMTKLLSSSSKPAQWLSLNHRQKDDNFTS